MGVLHIIDHPLIQHKLTIMREIQTGPKDFRELLNEITTLMGYEITRDFPLCEREIETPLTKMKGKTIEQHYLRVYPPQQGYTDLHQLRRRGAQHNRLH